MPRQLNCSIAGAQSSAQSQLSYRSIVQQLLYVSSVVYTRTCTLYTGWCSLCAGGVGAAAGAMEARTAAQAVLPSFQRSLHKYLRITRQQFRFTLEQVTDWLALALSFDLSPRLFLARFLQPGTALSYPVSLSRHPHACLLPPPLRSPTVVLYHFTTYDYSTLSCASNEYCTVYSTHIFKKFIFV